MDLAPGQDGNRNQYGEQVVGGQQRRSPTPSLHFPHHGAPSMRNSPFDPNPHPGDDMGLADGSHHQMSCHQGSSSLLLAPSVAFAVPDATLKSVAQHQAGRICHALFVILATAECYKMAADLV